MALGSEAGGQKLQNGSRRRAQDAEAQQMAVRLQPQTKLLAAIVCATTVRLTRNSTPIEENLAVVTRQDASPAAGIL